MLPAWYPALVALHLIFMVTFFGSTFWLVRLFVSHRLALARPDPDRGVLVKHFRRTEKQLLYVVAWPSLLLLVGFGAWMVVLQPALLKEPWMQAKLGLTGVLIAYHLVDQRIYGKLRRGERAWHSLALRIWVQGSVLILVAAVFLSAFKAVQWYVGLLGLAVLALLMLAGINAFGGKKEAMQEGKAE